MRIALIINARSPEVVGQLRECVAELRAAGHVVWPRLTFECGDAWRFAAEAARAGAELVIAAGGDGTLNEVANGLYEQLTREGTVPRLGIAPLGTANDLAAALGIPTELSAGLEVAVGGWPRGINVGLVNGRCFLNVSTGGFGAEATDAAAPATKRAFGTLAYLVEAIKSFAALEPSRARFTAEEVIHDGPFLLFAVGNSTRTGGGNELTPRAKLTDDLLDVCIVKDVSRMEFLGLLPDLRAGDHLEHPAVIYRQVRTLTVNAERELQVNADGEPLRDRGFRYEVGGQSLTLMVPPRRRVSDRS